MDTAFRPEAAGNEISMRPARVRYRRWRPALLCGICAAVALAQSEGPVQAPLAPATMGRPSIIQIYCVFLRFQLRLDQVADKLAKEGKDASDLRTNYQYMLGFSDEDYALVRLAATHIQDGLKPIADKRRELMEIHRTLAREHLGEPKPAIAPFSAQERDELSELRKQMDSLIETEIAAMKAALGPQKAARLDAFVQEMFAPKTQARPVTPSEADRLRKAQPDYKGDK